MKTRIATPPPASTAARSRSRSGATAPATSSPTARSTAQTRFSRAGLQHLRAARASTAAGTITVFDTRIDRVALGDIVLRDVNASINPHMQGRDVLLGMSFLGQLELTQRDGTLTLRHAE